MMNRPEAVERANDDDDGSIRNNNADAGEEQEEDTARFRQEQDLSKVLSRRDPDRMKVTKEERHNALEIKATIEMSADLEDLTDLMYVQLAIVCKDNVEDAVKRCHAMQEFRQDYKIVNNLEQAQRYLHWGVRLFPLFFLSFAFSETDGTYIFAHDVEKLEPKRFTSSEMIDDWMKHLYYSHILFFPDVESIRKGVVLIAECEGMTLRRDVLQLNNKFFSQFLAFYPFIGKSRCFHTGNMMNIIVSILRKIVPKDVADSIEVGLQFDGHLGDAFLVPTVEAANKRMLLRMEDALKLRYENEKVFKLTR